jgi:hypothetical protein
VKLKNSGMGVVEVGGRRLTKLARRPVTLNQMPELPPKASRVLAKLLTGDNIGWWEARVVRYADDDQVFLKFGPDERRIVSTRDCILKSRS